MKKIPHLFFTCTTTTYIYIVAAVIGMLSVGVLIFLLLPKDGAIDHGEVLRVDRTTVSSTSPCSYRRALDGVCTEIKAEQFSRLVAVMVENSSDAWPLSGVAAARVVYEAPVEGNIPRFMLLYTEDQEVALVGSVRSARPYYLDWLAEYGTPLYMHVGGSPDALARIAREGVNDFNEFYRGPYYWRDTRRYAPHNTYTSSERWQEALDVYEENYTTTTFKGWLFGDVNECVQECVQEISLSYLGNTYTATWRYNTSTEQYVRLQAGRIAADADGTQIVADTVIVQQVNTRVLDSLARLGMDTIGTGRSIVFQKGHVIEGSWQKQSRTDRTRFFDTEGEEIVLNPGQIWVQVINRSAVEYKVVKS